MCTRLQLGILCGRPFTADIAKETVPEQFWAMPGFRRTTYMLSWLWAAIFLIMTLSYVVRLLPWKNLIERAVFSWNHAASYKQSAENRDALVLAV